MKFVYAFQSSSYALYFESARSMKLERQVSLDPRRECLEG